MRLLAVVMLLALVLQLLLVPSRYDEHTLQGRLTSDRRITEEIFGTEAADHCWQRASAWHQTLIGGVPLFDIGGATTHSGQGPVAGSLDAVRGRVAGNSYFRAMRALLHLWCLRLAILLETWECTAFLAAAALLDGWTSRRLRRVLVRPDRPERFASAALVCIGTVGLVVALAGVPWAVSPSRLQTLLSIAALLAGQMLAWHHGGDRP